MAGPRPCHLTVADFTMAKGRRRSSSSGQQQGSLEAQRTAMQTKIEQELRASLAVADGEEQRVVCAMPPEPKSTTAVSGLVRTPEPELEPRATSGHHLPTGSGSNSASDAESEPRDDTRGAGGWGGRAWQPEPEPEPTGGGQPQPQPQRAQLDAQGERLQAVLHRAAASGDLPAVRQAVEGGADAGRRDGRHPWHTALMSAAQHGHVAVADYLVTSADADAMALRPDGMCALGLAAAAGHVALARWLVHWGGARPLHRDMAGRSVLALAVQRGHEELVQVLTVGGEAEAELHAVQARRQRGGARCPGERDGGRGVFCRVVLPPFRPGLGGWSCHPTHVPRVPSAGEFVELATALGGSSSSGAHPSAVRDRCGGPLRRFRRPF